MPMANSVSWSKRFPFSMWDCRDKCNGIKPSNFHFESHLQVPRYIFNANFRSKKARFPSNLLLSKLGDIFRDGSFFSAPGPFLGIPQSFAIHSNCSNNLVPRVRSLAGLLLSRGAPQVNGPWIRGCCDGRYIARVVW